MEKKTPQEKDAEETEVPEKEKHVVLVDEDDVVEEKERVRRRKRVPLYPGFPELARPDTSIFPSYTNFKLAYSVVCRHRYHFAKIAQRKQLMKELRSFEALQYNALDGVRVHREFSQGILSHKIPTRRYMNNLTPDPLTRQERMRLEEIIKGTASFTAK